jgi:hypothetical protein
MIDRVKGQQYYLQQPKVDHVPKYQKYKAAQGLFAQGI